MELEALGFGSIQEANEVVRISDGPEDEVLLPGGIVGDDAGLQLSELVGSTANTDKDGGVLLLVRILEDLVDTALAVLKRRFEPDQ